jgi:hypothetical protein
MRLSPLSSFFMFAILWYKRDLLDYVISPFFVSLICLIKSPYYNFSSLISKIAEEENSFYTSVLSSLLYPFCIVLMHLKMSWINSMSDPSLYIKFASSSWNLFTTENLSSINPASLLQWSLAPGLSFSCFSGTYIPTPAFDETYITTEF